LDASPVAALNLVLQLIKVTLYLVQLATEGVGKSVKIKAFYMLLSQLIKSRWVSVYTPLH